MKKLSGLELILGTAIFLILFVLIKDVMGHNNSKTQTQAEISPETYKVEAGPETRVSDTQIRVTRRIESQKKGDVFVDDICDDICRDDISQSLGSDGLLSADMIARIRENPAAFAEKLSSAPKTLSDLFMTLKDDEEDDNGTQFAALAVLQVLSGEDKLTLAKTLTTLNRNQDRIMGLELLEKTMETQTGSIQTLNKLLENEGDPSVLSKAIRITSNLPEGTEVQGALQALTKIIQYNSNDHVSGAALLAKVSIAPSSDIVYEDIVASLTSFSNDKTAVGLTALQTALSRDDTAFASEGEWYDDLSLRESVRAIAKNQQLSEETRSRANHLLNSYFSDD